MINIKFTLKNDKDDETVTSVPIVIREPFIEYSRVNLTKDLKDEIISIELNDQVDKAKNLSWKIESIDNLGLMTVRFN